VHPFRLAEDAFDPGRASARPSYKSHQKIDGFRSLQTEAYTRQLAVIDPHPNDKCA
jgi:hypothetical protein